MLKNMLQEGTLQQLIFREQDQFKETSESESEIEEEPLVIKMLQSMV
jgi:hypothetical protein